MTMRLALDEEILIVDGLEDGAGAVGKGHDIVRACDLREQLLQFGLCELQL